MFLICVRLIMLGIGIMSQIIFYPELHLSPSEILFCSKLYVMYYIDILAGRGLCSRLRKGISKAVLEALAT